MGNNYSFLKSVFMVTFALALGACSKQSTDGPGRSIVATDVTRGSGSGGIVVEPGPEVEPVNGKILLTQYPDTIPNGKVCKTVLTGRSEDTLKKFFAWDIQNLEGPVTVCIEQDSLASRCPAGEAKCANGINRNVRIRIEYEDDFRFWYYDSASPANYAKVLRYTGGSSASNVEIILQDGAGFLRVAGAKNSAGMYNLSFSFADRPSYSAALAYDQARGYNGTEYDRRAATISDIAACAKSSAGNAKFTDGTDCARRFVLPYTFFTDFATAYPQGGVTDYDLWLQNQATVAAQLNLNSFPTYFSLYGVNRGVFGGLVVENL